MRIEEARWIQSVLSRHLLAGAPGGVVPGLSGVALNLGSGTRKAREVNKPWIHQMTLRPLADAGLRVVNSDLVDGDGIDIAGDLFNTDIQDRLRALTPAVVMFCNVIEHLPARLLDRVPAALDAIVAPGALLLVAAPRSYPYHPDPIDNLHRPSPEQIAAMFPGYRVVESAVVDSEGYLPEFQRAGVLKRVRKFLRLLFPFVRPRRWFSHAHRMLWLWRPYQHSLVLLRKGG